MPYCLDKIRENNTTILIDTKFNVRDTNNINKENILLWNTMIEYYSFLLFRGQIEKHNNIQNSKYVYKYISVNNNYESELNVNNFINIACYSIHTKQLTYNLIDLVHIDNIRHFPNILYDYLFLLDLLEQYFISLDKSNDPSNTEQLIGCSLQDIMSQLNRLDLIIKFNKLEDFNQNI